MNRGLVAAALGFAWWGFFPIYFRLLPGTWPPEVLANRIVWSLLILLAVARGNAAMGLACSGAAAARARGLRGQRDAAVGQLDHLHLGRLARSRGRREPRLFHDAAGQCRPRLRRARRATAPRPMARARARRDRRRLAHGERRAAAMDRPRARVELRCLRAAAQDRRARAARGPGAGDDAPGAARPLRHGMVVGQQRHQLSGADAGRQPLAARPRPGDDAAAAPVRLRRAAPAADRARPVPVREPDGAVPARRLALPRARERGAGSSASR